MGIVLIPFAEDELTHTNYHVSATGAFAVIIITRLSPALAREQPEREALVWQLSVPTAPSMVLCAWLARKTQMLDSPKCICEALKRFPRPERASQMPARPSGC